MYYGNNYFDFGLGSYKVVLVWFIYNYYLQLTFITKSLLEGYILTAKA